MNILSLFDGMSCGMIAMLNAGVNVDRYVAYEIDKYAVKTSAHNFPMIEHMGDVFGADFTQYVGFDWLIGGSPCTYWSIAQTKNRETTASGIGWELFSQYVRALQEAKPKYFIYENNKSMSQAIRDSISLTFGFEPVCINSALVSAQNRQRLYWVGKRQADGTYKKVNVRQPADKGVLLKDILDGEAMPVSCAVNDKSFTIKAQYARTGPANLLTNGKYNATGVAEPLRVGCMPSPDGILKNSQGYRIYPVNGDSVTLAGNGGGLGARTGLYGVPACESPTDGYVVQTGRITVNGNEYPIKLPDGYYHIRKLSVDECKRLQTVPDWYEFPVSNTQAYKMLGNGWTCDVITHLIKSCLQEQPEELTLF